MCDKQTLNIKGLPLTTIKPGDLIMLVGKRKSGKSVAAFNLLHHLRNQFDYVVSVCPTETTNEELENIMPTGLMYRNPEKLTKILDTVFRLAGSMRRNNIKRNFLVFVDDCMANKKLFKTKEMREIFLNGRHNNITFICCVQYLMDMPIDLRSMVDWVVAFGEDQMPNMERLYNYFFSIFGTFHAFRQTLEAITLDYGTLVLNNTLRASLLDKVYWYKAKLIVPPFTLCRCSCMRKNKAECDASCKNTVWSCQRHYGRLHNSHPDDSMLHPMVENENEAIAKQTATQTATGAKRVFNEVKMLPPPVPRPKTYAGAKVREDFMRVAK